MLKMYRGLILSRLLYTLPLIKIARPQYNSLETFHRVALRFGLRVPFFSGHVSTLTEPQEIFLQHYADERTLLHIERISRTVFTSHLLYRLCSRPHSRIGRLALQFQEQLGFPDNLTCTTLPYGGRQPLIVHESFDGIVIKMDIPSCVCRTYLADVLDMRYKSFIHVYIDGLVD